MNGQSSNVASRRNAPKSANLTTAAASTDFVMLHHGTKQVCSLWVLPELPMIAEGRRDEIM